MNTKNTLILFLIVLIATFVGIYIADIVDVIFKHNKDIYSWSEEVCKNHNGVSGAASGKILDKEYYITMCKDGTSILNEQDKHE